MTTPFHLDGRRLLVIGAASGIGAATARLCARLGADLVLADVADCAPLAAEVAAAKGKPSVHRCDVSDRAAVDRLVAAAGPIDAMVVCAAVLIMEDWEKPGWDEAFHRTMRINVQGSINCARAALPGMIARRSGRIVLIGSIAGQMGGIVAGPHYVASKGGIHALVKWLARKGAPHNVLVNGVAPGPVRTPMLAGQEPDGRHIPLGRLAEAEEIAAPIAFLCSPAASYVTGAMLSVNAGVYMA